MRNQMKHSLGNRGRTIMEEDLACILADHHLEWDVFRDKRILVSGAAGFLPAYMIETLLKLNEERQYHMRVIGLARTLDRAKERFLLYKDREDLQLIQHDVQYAFENAEKFDYIIHAASNASPKYYGSDPVGTLSANVSGTQHLLELAVQHKSEGFLYFSSGEVYGEVAESQIPTAEQMYGIVDPLDVRSCYAESKRMGETLCVAYAKQYGVPAKIVRPFHTYGPGMRLDDGRVFADFVANVVRGEAIQLHSDGSARRAFCYLADAVRGFFTVLLKGKVGNAYNVGSPTETSIKELAELLARLYPEQKLHVELAKDETAAGYIVSKISRNCPDIRGIAGLGWKPRISLAEGFKRTIESYW